MDRNKVIIACEWVEVLITVATMLNRQLPVRMSRQLR